LFILAAQARAALNVVAEWTAETPEQVFVAVNKEALESDIEYRLRDVYQSAGLPADLGATAVIYGTLQAGTAPPGVAPTTAPPTTTRAAAAAPPPPNPGGGESGGDNSGDGNSDNMGLLIGVVVVGVVGLAGIAAYFLLWKGRDRRQVEGWRAGVIPVKIERPPPSPKASAPVPAAIPVQTQHSAPVPVALPVQQQHSAPVPAAIPVQPQASALFPLPPPPSELQPRGVPLYPVHFPAAAPQYSAVHLPSAPPWPPPPRAASSSDVLFRIPESMRARLTVALRDV